MGSLRAQRVELSEEQKAEIAERQARYDAKAAEDMEKFAQRCAKLEAMTAEEKKIFLLAEQKENNRLYAQAVAMQGESILH